MPMPDPTPPVALEPVRQRTIQVLCDHFAADHIGDAELEARLDRAHAATSLEALGALLADLPALSGAPGASPAAPLPAGMAARPLPAAVTERQWVLAVMGASSRKGAWTPPRQLNVFAAMGGVELDFREARFGPGVTEINVFAMMGGVEIVVPPGLYVEATGVVAIMGGVENRAHGYPPADPSTPFLRIRGALLMGGVEITVRLPGESAGDAKAREKLARKEARRLARGD